VSLPKVTIKMIKGQYGGIRSMNTYVKIFIIILCVIVLLGILYVYNINKYLKLGIGKKMVIIIHDNEIVDYKSINTVKMGNGAPLPWFNMIANTEKEKLINYMRENNLRIIPGKYIIFQTSKFVDLKKTLKFDYINNSN